jgi:hypothetical protein
MAFARFMARQLARPSGLFGRLSFENETGTVKDCIGLRHIGRLLQTPGRE